MSSVTYLAISEHNLTVVGMDASYLKPFVTSYIRIGPGQTMDILVTTNQSLGLYYIAARQHFTGPSGFPYYDKANVTAILEYRGNYTFSASPSFPSDTLPSYTDYDPEANFLNKLKSLHDQNVPKNITTRMYIAAAMNALPTKIGNLFIVSTLNNVSFVNPKTDVLHAYY